MDVDSGVCKGSVHLHYEDLAFLTVGRFSKILRGKLHLKRNCSHSVRFWESYTAQIPQEFPRTDNHPSRCNGGGTVSVDNTGGRNVDVDTSVFIGKGNVMNFPTSFRSLVSSVFELLIF